MMCGSLKHCFTTEQLIMMLDYQTGISEELSIIVRISVINCCFFILETCYGVCNRLLQ